MNHQYANFHVFIKKFTIDVIYGYNGISCALSWPSPIFSL